MNTVENITERYWQYCHDLGVAQASVSLTELELAFAVIKKVIRSENTIYICGNGGSATLADHWATDLGKGSRTETLVRPKIVSLNSNMGLITAIANDIGYDRVFAYQLESLLVPGDALIAISSSGNSENIQNAVKAARQVNNCVSIGITGFELDNWTNLNSDIRIHINSKNYGIVECVTSNIMHSLTQTVRKEFALPGAEKNAFTF